MTDHTLVDDSLVDDSLVDADVVLRNPELVRLLAHQPPGAVRDAVLSAARHESRTVLAHRHQGYVSVAERQLARIPALRTAAEPLAKEWADYRFTRDAEAILLILRLGAAADPAEVLRVEGQDVLDRIQAEGKAPLFVSAHYGAYQALPIALAALGQQVAVLMDGQARSLADGLFRALAPQHLDQLTLLSAHDPMVLAQLLRHLISRRPLLLFPEFAFSSRGYPTGQFLGRQVYTPPGAEVLSGKTGAPVVPVRLRQQAHEFTLEVGEPFTAPGEALDKGKVTRRVFSWLESVVSREPARWWCWEIFEELMAADSEPSALTSGP